MARNPKLIHTAEGPPPGWEEWLKGQELDCFRSVFPRECVREVEPQWKFPGYLLRGLVRSPREGWTPGQLLQAARAYLPQVRGRAWRAMFPDLALKASLGAVLRLTDAEIQAVLVLGALDEP